jgi:membrane protein DedA with SNARE-associated domain
MNLAPFLLFTAIGAGLWTALLASLGYLLGENFGKVEEYLDPVSYFIVAALVGLYVMRVLTHRTREEHERLHRSDRSA